MQAVIDQHAQHTKHAKYAKHAKHAQHAKHADAAFCLLILVTALQAMEAGPALCDSDDAGCQAGAAANPGASSRAVFQWEGSRTAPATSIHATLSHVRPLPQPPFLETLKRISCIRMISCLVFLAPEQSHP